MTEGGNRDPNRIPTRTKHGESWIVGTVSMYIEECPEGVQYEEVSVEEFLNGYNKLIFNPSVDKQPESIIDREVGTGNLAVASICSPYGQYYHGYTTDPSVCDLVLERLETRLGVTARREREHIDLRFN